MKETGFNWYADLGDGNYRNPVLYTDYSDPDAIRVGDDYFMTASSFKGFGQLEGYQLCDKKHSV